jgi:serine/threonine protein kinase
VGFLLVQSYFKASSLEQVIASGYRFDEYQLRDIAQQILEVLVYLQSRLPPVIHRDLKPSNILLDRSGVSTAQSCVEQGGGRVIVVDFGSVQTLTAQMGNTITVVGTYGYMPPEQFGGQTGPSSDLYSLGATLVHLTTGLHPADLPQVNLALQFEPQRIFGNTEKVKKSSGQPA